MCVCVCVCDYVHMCNKTNYYVSAPVHMCIYIIMCVHVSMCAAIVHVAVSVHCDLAGKQV